MIRGLCVLVCFAVLPRSPLVAATFYVNGATGDDKSVGAAADKAFKTISRAASVAKPGDTVLVAPGVYDEQVGVGGFREATERTVLRAEPLGKAILDGAEKQFRFSIRRPKVSLIGFECRKSREHAIDFNEPADDGLVSACVLVDNKLDGAFFRKCKGGRVETTVCARNGRHGIWFLQNEGGVAVANTCLGNRGSGLCVADTPGVVAFDNIFAANGVGIRLSGAAVGTLRSDHNLLEGGFLGQVHGPDWLFGASAGTLADWQALSGQDAHSICGDPMLADAKAGDFAPLAPPRGNRSPALRPDLRVERFEGVEAPTADLAGRTKAPALGAVWLDAEPAGEPLASLSMPFDGLVSVGIFDAGGQLVRSLLAAYPAAKGKLDLYWDGKDNLGRDVPPGQLRWRAVAHNARGVDDGSVGDTGQPPYGKTQVSDGVWNLAADARGDLYEISFWDEAGHGLRKLKADGSADWVIPFYIRNTAGGYGTAVATDGKYVFAALAHHTRDRDGGRAIADDVRRLDAATGAPTNFPAEAGAKPANVIVVNPEKPEAWIPHQHLGTDGSRAMFGVRGLATDAKHLFVSNYFKGRVETYDKETGRKLSEFAVPKPLGIAAAPDGTLWLANSGDRVTQFALDGSRKAEIAGLEDPYAVAIGGPQGHLFLTETGAGRIREYALEAAGPRQVRPLGRAAGGPGPVTPDAFRWGDPSGIAVDPQGRITVTDIGNHRVQRFRPDGSLWQSLYSDFVAAPFVDLRQPDVLISGTRQYHVDSATGRWEFTHNWQPADGKFATGMVLRRPLPNGRDYLFCLGGHRLGVVIYAIEADTMRRSAMLGGRWMGTDDLGKGAAAGMYFWSDANGNGQVEDAEMTWTQKPEKGYAYSALAPGWWADERGDLWLADQVTRSILRLRLLGFDGRNNPRYDWAQRQTVVPCDDSPWKFEPKNLRIAPDGDLYVQGTIAQNRETGPFWMAGTAVARYAPDGARRWLLPLPRLAVATATDGDLWYAAEGPTGKLNLYTADALFLCATAPGRPSGYQTGWIDHAMGIFAFVHPKTKTHYAYAEEDLFGKVIRYRIDGLGTLRRFEGTLAWPGGGK